MAKKVVEWEQECEGCAGTGIYKGYAEGDGFGVVCSRCKGTGKEKMFFKYTPFTQRKRRQGIVRVVETNPGVGLSLHMEGNYSYEDFGGISYKDWFSGKKFKKGQELRLFTCPAWWYQGANYELKPKWTECISLGYFSACDSFKNKDKCWKRFDKEQTK